LKIVTDELLSVSDLLDLAFAGEQCGVGTLATPFDDSERADACAGCELFGFFEAFGVTGLAEIETDENSRPAGAWAIGHQELDITDIKRLGFGLLGN
jgi:hypothetical protein